MRQVPQWDFIETSFYSDSFVSNPFIDVDFEVVFTKGVYLLQCDGFYDGIENTLHCYRVRFAPEYQGTWKYQTISNAQSLNGLEDEFECIAPVSPSGLTLSPHFSNWFMRQNGAYQFIVSDG
jgi:hypothetical protein